MAIPFSLNKKILHIALPAIISNITVPVLGLADTAIAGHLGSPAYIGAIAVGVMLLNLIYWIFGFLRMGTSGLTAQAFGSRQLTKTAHLLVRSVITGLGIAFLLLLFKTPLLNMVFHLIEAPDMVKELTIRYFNICIWGGPAVLGLYSFTGWFIGMQNTRLPMLIAISQNILNILVSLTLVFGFDMGIEGLAWGTVTAEYAGFLFAVFFWFKYYAKIRRKTHWQLLFNMKDLTQFFTVNTDIFFRTLCVMAVTLFFTSAGGAQGETVLAVNALLMQLFTLFSYVMDGFAYAGEALGGKYAGARNKKMMQKTVHLLFRYGLSLALIFTVLYAVGSNALLSLLTNEKTVLKDAHTYYYWVLAIPLTGFAAFLWDGIFIGLTATRHMLYAMIVATICFFVLYLSLFEVWENHALWFAFIFYLSIRGMLQTKMGLSLIKRI